MQAAGKKWIWHNSRTDVFKVWNLSDIHLLSRGCAENDLKRDILAIAEDPFSFWLGGGDYAEFIGGRDKRFDPTCVAKWVPLEKLGDIGKYSMEVVRDRFAPIKHKCLGLLMGNHEYKHLLHNDQQSLHHWLCTELGVTDLGYSCMFHLVFAMTKRTKAPKLMLAPPAGSYNSWDVRVFAHHGAGGASTPGGKLNRLTQFMDSFDADLYFCLDEETELMTCDGWKQQSQIQTGDAVFSFKNGMIERDTVLDVIRKPYHGSMYRVQNRSMDMLMAPGHRVLYRSPLRGNRPGPWRFKYAEDFFSRRYQGQVQIPCSGSIRSSGAEVSDNELKLTGWIISEGHFHRTEPKGGHGISIYQSAKNDRKVKDIRELLNRMDATYTERLRKDGVVVFYIVAKDGRKIEQKLISEKGLPDWVWNLNDAQFSLLLSPMVDGDGHKKSMNCWDYYSSNEKLIDDLQRLAVIHGWRAAKRPSESGFSDGKNWVLNMCHRQTVDHPFSRNPAVLVPYDGKIWCIKTKNETFIARRNGQVFITGNCGHVHDNLARKQPVLGIDAAGEKIVQRERMGLVAGSYLKTYSQDTTSYGEQKGYRPTSLGASVAELHPDAKTMRAAI